MELEHPPKNPPTKTKMKNEIMQEKKRGVKS